MLYVDDMCKSYGKVPFQGRRALVSGQPDGQPGKRVGGPKASRKTGSQYITYYVGGSHLFWAEVAVRLVYPCERETHKGT